MMLFIGIGGILGAITRFSIGQWISRGNPHSVFPFGTWIVNVTGSLALGVLAVLHLHHVTPEWIWFFAGVGFLGAYTTFSTFCYETVQLLHKRLYGTAILYVSTSVILGLVCAWIGFVFTETMV